MIHYRIILQIQGIINEFAIKNVKQTQPENTVTLIKCIKNVNTDNCIFLSPLSLTHIYKW